MPRWTEEQKKAIYSSGQNILVSAGAGSGKTAVLSERVLNHILNGINVDDLLILTFTNAAAMEMKERIRNKILQYDEIKDQADRIDVANITTFDAFALSLVKKYSHLLNVSNNISIIDSGLISLKKRDFLEEIFDRRYEEEDKLFLKLINDFCLKDDKEIFNEILKINDKMDNLYEKEGYLENYVTNYYNEKMVSKFISEYYELLHSKIKEIKTRIKYLESYVDYSYIDKLLTSLSLVLNASCYEDIKSGLPDRLPVLRGGSEEAKKIKNDINDIVKELKELTGYENSDIIKHTILSTKDYALVICDILLELTNKINDFKRYNDAYEFIDIAKMAIKVMLENDSIRLELKDKYQEILIDEYQDTNDIQDKFVELICNNNVYMVGDIKQSIYRFRGANPLLFKSKYDKYSKNIDGMKIDLNKNFRSRNEVCIGINLIFNLIMDDEIGGANYFDSHQMVYGNKSYENACNEDYQMEILNYNNDTEFSDEELEMFTIAYDIKDKINSGYKIMDKDSGVERNVCYSDFAILMDRSSNFETYKKVFEYLNIPLSIYRDKTISNSIDIMLIRNLYQIILKIYDRNYDTNFKHSFMSILRSYLYRLDDDVVFKIIAFNEFKDIDLYNKCFAIACELDNLNNRELYLKILDVFEFYDKIITVGDVNEHIVTLDAILKLVTNLNDFGYSPRMFLDYLNEVFDKGLDIKLAINKDSSNSVKIMTIHGSKGLEWPICYFSGLYKKFNIGDLKDKFYFSLDYGIVMPYSNDGLKTTIVKTLLKNRYKNDEISEQLRLLYVAFTRVREKVIIVTKFKDLLSFKDNGLIDTATRGKYMSFMDVLSSLKNSLEGYTKLVDTSKLGLTKAYNFHSEALADFDVFDISDIVVSEYQGTNENVSVSNFSKKVHNLISFKERENIDLGLRMHKVFEMVDFKNPDYSKLSSFEKNLVSNFLKEDIVRNALKFYKEFEFIYEDEGVERHGIIDLLILLDDRYVIVDYKLNDVTDEAYVKQLCGYRDYILNITGVKTDIYLYSIIDGKLAEIK